MITAMVAFGVMIFLVSLCIARRARASCDSGEIGTYVVLTAWGSLVMGLFVSRLGA
jgi:hypothetical protein